MRLPYGEGTLEVELPAANLMGVIHPSRAGADGGPSAAQEQAAVAAALAAPIGAPRLRELARGARSAAIVVSDVTRPCPSYKFLPALLDELAGIDPGNVRVLFALGGHRLHTEAEKRLLLGDAVAAKVEALDLDVADCVPVGRTSRGTPLEVYRPFLEADVKIGTGNIEYHYFAGYSGGAKAVVPGICTPLAIRSNHSMMLQPQARAGVLAGNPVREDIDEAGGIVGIDFVFNVLLDGRKRILDAVAGHYLDAHREGVRLYDERFNVSIAEAADIVLASAGGHPKDINLYQAQKTLENVRGAVRPGGTIVLAARCGEGFGQPIFERWMREMTDPQMLIDRIRREFVLGGHKAAAVADLLLQNDVYLVSAFPDDVVERMGMRPFADLSAALAAAFAHHGDDARVLVVPYGNRVTAAGRGVSERR